MASVGCRCGTGTTRPPRTPYERGQSGPGRGTPARAGVRQGAGRGGRAGPGRRRGRVRGGAPDELAMKRSARAASGAPARYRLLPSSQPRARRTRRTASAVREQRLFTSRTATWRRRNTGWGSACPIMCGRPVDGVAYDQVATERLEPPQKSAIQEVFGERRPSGWVLASCARPCPESDGSQSLRQARVTMAWWWAVRSALTDGHLPDQPPLRLSGTWRLSRARTP